MKIGIIADIYTDSDKFVIISSTGSGGKIILSKPIKTDNDFSLGDIVEFDNQYVDLLQRSLSDIEKEKIHHCYKIYREMLGIETADCKKMRKHLHQKESKEHLKTWISCEQRRIKLTKLIDNITNNQLLYKKDFKSLFYIKSFSFFWYIRFYR